MGGHTFRAMTRAIPSVHPVVKLETPVEDAYQTFRGSGAGGDGS